MSDNVAHDLGLVRDGWRSGIESSIATIESQLRKPRDLWHPAYFAALEEAIVHLQAMLERGTERATGSTVCTEVAK